MLNLNLTPFTRKSELPITDLAGGGKIIINKIILISITQYAISVNLSWSWLWNAVVSNVSSSTCSFKYLWWLDSLAQVIIHFYIFTFVYDKKNLPWKLAAWRCIGDGLKEGGKLKCVVANYTYGQGPKVVKNYWITLLLIFFNSWWVIAYFIWMDTTRSW